MRPRKPTKQEKKDLLHYYIATCSPSQSEIENYKLWLDDAPIAVFDEYVTGSPDYAGRIMLTVGGCADLVNVYTWRKRRIPEQEEPRRALIDRDDLHHDGELYQEMISYPFATEEDFGHPKPPDINETRSVKPLDTHRTILRRNQRTKEP